MTRVYVGPVALYDLGMVGELGLLTALDGDIVIPQPVVDEITEEPARTALANLIDEEPISTAVDDGEVERAVRVLGEEGERDGDGGDDGEGGEGGPSASAAVVAGVLAHAEHDDRSAVGVVSEDRRLRTVAEAFGAGVTSGFGVVVRAALSDTSLKPGHVKRIVRRMDTHGLHMTGEMRERAVGEAGG